LAEINKSSDKIAAKKSEQFYLEILVKPAKELNKVAITTSEWES